MPWHNKIRPQLISMAITAAVFFLPMGVQAATTSYDFESDSTGSAPANTTVVSGAATVENDATLGSKSLKMTGNTVRIKLDNVPLTSNDIDFSFRARLDSGDQMGLALFTDSSMVNFYFLQWDTSSDNRIELYKATAPFLTLASLANDGTLPSTTNYKWRVTVTVSGSSTTITAYSWNGSSWVSEFAHTDSSSAFTTGGLGFFHVNGNPAFVDDLSVTYIEAQGINITSPTAYRVFQRSSTGAANLPVSGTYTGSPTAIEARWNSGSWVTIDSSPSGSTFSGTLYGLSEGQGALQARFTNDTTQSGSIAYVGIGDIFAVIGQSNASGRGDNNQSYSHATLRASMFTGNGWQNMSDPTNDRESGAGGSVWPLIATKYMTNQSVPVAFLTDISVGGTQISAWQKGGTYYTNAGYSLANRLAAVGSVKAALWWQGEFESGSNTTQASYLSSLVQLARDINTDFSIPTFVASIGYYNAGKSTGLNNVRTAQQLAWGSGSIKAGPSLYDIKLVDSAGVHFTTNAELQTAANRWWDAIEESLYNGTTGRGPRFHAAEENSARTKITVTLTGGVLPITPTTSLQGFSVRDSGTPATVSSAVRGDSGTVIITLSSALSGTPTVSFGSGNSANNVTVPTDSSTNNLPTEVFIGQSVSTASGPTISSLVSSISGTSATITWNTDESASTRVRYGASPTTPIFTNVRDTAPRTLSHSITLSNLASCATYHYLATSVDNATNSTNSSAGTFSIAGCTGSASIITSSGTTILNGAAGSVSLIDSVTGTGLALTIPTGFYSDGLDFQIQYVDSTNVLATTSTPNERSLAGNNTFELRAITGSTSVTSFSTALTVSITYNISDISGLDETTLQLYRWDGSSWNALTGCSVNLTTRVVTCTTTSFSTFGLFGAAASTSTTSTATTSTSGSGGGGGRRNTAEFIQNFLKQREQADITAITESDSGDQEEETTTLRILVDGSRSVSFKDVPTKEWYAPYVVRMLRNRIASGYRDTNGTPTGFFGPSNPLTYAELSKISLNALGISLIEGQPRNSSAAVHWSSNYIRTMESLNASIYTETLKVNTPATRGAVIQTILENAGIEMSSDHGSQFADLPRSHPYANAMNTAAWLGIIDSDKNTVRPDDSMNRAEIAKVIVKLLDKSN